MLIVKIICEVFQPNPVPMVIREDLAKHHEHWHDQEDQEPENHQKNHDPLDEIAHMNGRCPQLSILISHRFDTSRLRRLPDFCSDGSNVVFLV